MATKPTKGAKGPASVPPTVTSSSWKDHPIPVAAGAVLATLTATIALFTQVVIPARDVDLTNKVKSLESEKEQLGKKIAAKDVELTASKASEAAIASDLKATKADLQVARQAQLFSPAEAYPNGLRAVRVGEGAEAVAKAYPRAIIDKSKDGGVVVLRDPQHVFSKVSFYFDPDDRGKTITHIVFEIERKKEFDEAFLQTKLREALGPPRIGAKATDCAWFKSKAHGVFKADPYSYFVMLEGNTPRWWKSS